ncbi:hypothetical protein PROFUN_14160 [Planoprotostelium fungivorum]|uniref:Uncharacterized protein n=1 Tax=Planoprotostelium fungivorum TaxID=1890364 RepID=A0A2P6N1M6_9EUKA|nr:hypothetical protein PROFUN_14160 [Planoprotostelium fungivorum]
MSCTSLFPDLPDPSSFVLLLAQEGPMTLFSTVALFPDYDPNAQKLVLSKLSQTLFNKGFLFFVACDSGRFI